MSRSRFTMTGLVTVAAAAGFTLAGCHSSFGSASGSATASSSAPTAAAAVATAGSAVVSGAGSVAYFPDQVGDTWVYAVDADGNKGTVTNRVAAVTRISSGTQVTMQDTDTMFSSSKPTTMKYIVHSDGSISIPVDFGGTSGLTLKSGNLGWPAPAQLASGQPENDTIVMTGSLGGKSTTITAKTVVKGEGKQSVSVPAGRYSATVVDEKLTEAILGTPSTSDTKTWLVTGVGPVKTEVTSMVNGSSFIAEEEQLTSFTQG